MIRLQQLINQLHKTIRQATTDATADEDSTTDPGRDDSFAPDDGGDFLGGDDDSYV